ncbi:MAG: C-terminal binding protein [Ectothiorhodospiraceae bacterium]|nr:C-terminal binding protein [Chromatiales bacterium]MCP5153590.1 C-terminal binding protein [Ectothiorhodospiraceae bacterium]
MRILITDRNFEGDIDVEREAAPPGTQIELFPDGNAVTEEAWREAEAVITFRFTPAVTARMADMKRCRIIVRGGVGFDGLDLAGFGARGIPICNVPDYGTTEVADHAIALMLALRRGITSYHDRMREDPRTHWHHRHGRVVERLRGARFGVVGLGRIGLAAARRAAAFDQEVVFYDPHVPPGTELATGLARAATLAELLGSCDAVSLHTPLSDETRNLINRETLAQMKPGAVLVNTSRGPVVDIDAVHHALREGHLAGAALDVLPTEPPPTDHPLIKAYMAREDWIDGRLIITPHSAFFSVPGQRDLRRKAVETIVAYLQDGTLRNCVNADVLRRNAAP